jgi:hypothetical protein
LALILHILILVMADPESQPAGSAKQANSYLKTCQVKQFYLARNSAIVSDRECWYQGKMVLQMEGGHDGFAKSRRRASQVGAGAFREQKPTLAEKSHFVVIVR